MHWVASSKKDTATGTLEKRLWNAADQFRADSAEKTDETGRLCRMSLH